MPTIKEMQHFVELLKEENNSLREKIYAQTKLIETIKARLAEIEKLWAEYGEIYWDGAKASEDRIYKTPESRVEWARDLADVECLLSAAIKGE